MSKKKAFISFDFDHDEDLRNLLVGQSMNPDSPFELRDWSIREQLTGDWKEKARKRIRGCDIVIVMCGEYTDAALGVSMELQMAQAERIPYFLLRGRSDKHCMRPQAALASDKMYNWTWDNLKALIAGAR